MRESGTTGHRRPRCGDYGKNPDSNSIPIKDNQRSIETQKTETGTKSRMGANPRSSTSSEWNRYKWRIYSKTTGIQKVQGERGPTSGGGALDPERLRSRSVFNLLEIVCFRVKTCYLSGVEVFSS
ncbi:hypothetical protein EVAR_22445_1 [Eumeta japonica]|uniref:Uncharacterized protein n=1 Tax=Eumeta variegata TaxID=151549 RepID=A0A4C1VCF8_EUMVA|nr:hypothetical protein EVAR_22445_1 [Eumeta japonica]